MYYPLEPFLDIDMTYIIQTFSQNVFIFFVQFIANKECECSMAM